MKLTTGVFWVIILAAVCPADYLSLKDGNAGTVEVLDSTGCTVTFRRHGKVVTIAKEKIGFAVCGKDTVNYGGFMCTPELAGRQSGRVFRNTYNVEKVNAIINAMPHDTMSNRNCLMYYFTQPVNGKEFASCWDDKFKVFEARLKKLYPTVQPVSQDKLHDLLTNKNDTNRVLIPYRVTFEDDEPGKSVHISNTVSGGPMQFAGPVMVSAATLPVVVVVKIVDLKSGSIVYDDTSKFKAAVDFGDQKENVGEARAMALENALLNSIDATRKFFSRLLWQGL